jgi:hypothetical protein
MALICGFRAATVGEHITSRWTLLIPGGPANWPVPICVAKPTGRARAGLRGVDRPVVEHQDN